jgi:hypothetical protein
VHVRRTNYCTDFSAFQRQDFGSADNSRLLHAVKPFGQGAQARLVQAWPQAVRAKTKDDVPNPFRLGALVTCIQGAECFANFPGAGVALAGTPGKKTDE